MSDAILLVSFGGPEGPEDVIPFLENVLRGRNVPRQRMLEVAEHYYHFGGRSPINDQNRRLVSELRALLAAQGPPLPVYWGNRNWHPLLPDTLAAMRADGIRRAFAFVTSAYSSYSGCRQYREDIALAQQQSGTEDLEVLKLRVYYNHPGFIGPVIDAARAALETIPARNRGNAVIRFTAHSVPLSMATTSRYVAQLEDACRLVADALGRPDYRMVYQSRSGPPTQPWLEPDLLAELRALAAAGTRDVALIPIGFVSDHMEVVYDLDTEARRVCEDLGLNLVRAATPGADPRFVAMIRELAMERMGLLSTRRALGSLGPSHDVCPADCCPAPAR
ncbi:MAG TPA: ferrochelatase [Bryobacteraceae bacterium]|nr:ferrochelatase [Bryobacteraceae bacterium]